MEENEKKIGGEFPANSHKVKDERIEQKKVEKVIVGKAVRQKKSFGRKFVDTFMGEDVVDVKSYVIHDVLVPALKDMMFESVKGSFEMMLFGERKGSRTSRDRGTSRVNYSGLSSSSRTSLDSRRDDRREFSQRSRASHNFDDIKLETRGEAEEVLSNLVDLTLDYGSASISDLYDLVGITANFTDNKYGWFDLSKAHIDRVRGGYMISLPKAQLLD